MTDAQAGAEPGRAVRLAPDLRRVVAPNPSAMTFRGTNSFLLGRGEVAVIDPGPAIPAHLDALLAALEPGERISHIFVTHSHLDHSGLARPLATATAAPVHAFGPSGAGRSAARASTVVPSRRPSSTATVTSRVDRRPVPLSTLAIVTLIGAISAANAPAACAAHARCWLRAPYSSIRARGIA